MFVEGYSAHNARRSQDKAGNEIQVHLARPIGRYQCLTMFFRLARVRECFSIQQGEKKWRVSAMTQKGAEGSCS
jgi:hypothetical protein